MPGETDPSQPPERPQPAPIAEAATPEAATNGGNNPSLHAAGDETPPPPPAGPNPPPPAIPLLSTRPARIESVPATSPKFPEIPGYEILAELGRGGMGVVYKARQFRPNRLVAIKMVLAGEYASRDAITRFCLEAEAVAQLQHPNIVQVHAVDEHRGHPYFVMEYFDGGTLGLRLGERRPPPREAAEVVETLARAVQHAHERGIIHRDLKPANILMTSGGVPKISDFGLAKRTAEAASLTPTGAVIGTPQYMAPEQAAGKGEGNARAGDIYSLGVILYELITGRRPFDGGTDLEILHRIAKEMPPSPAWLQPSVPRDLETICMKCLRKEPEKRYDTAEALADDLRRFCEGRPIVGRRSTLFERARDQVKYRPLRVAAAVAGVLAISALVYGVWHGYAYRWEHVEYYRTFVRRWEALEGQGRLSSSEAARLNVSMRFVHRGRFGLLSRVEMVNSQNQLTPWNGVTLIIAGIREGLPSTVPDCSFRFEYDQHGRIARESGHDLDGNMLWQLRYERGSKGETTAGDQVSSRFYDPQGNVVTVSTGASGVRIGHTPDGYVRSIRYVDAFGKPSTNSAGVYGQDWEYENGVAVSLTNVDASGRPAMDREGVTIERYRLDDRLPCLVDRVTYETADGAPALVRSGYHALETQYDADGNVVEFAYRDFDGNLVPSETGHALKRFEYENGRSPRMHIFNLSGKLQMRVDWTYDEFGRATSAADTHYIEEEIVGSRSVRHFDRQSNPLSRDDWGRQGVNYIGKIAWTYDELYRQDSETLTDAQGRVIEKIVWTYDGNRKSEERRYGDEGRALTGISRFEFDPYGNKLLETRLAADGQSLVGSSRFEYERVRGLEKERIDSDANGNVTLRTNKLYNEYGKPFKIEYFDADGKPTPNAEGMVAIEIEYDRGRMTQKTFLAAVGALVARRVEKFDRVGAFIDDGFYLEAYFDEHGEPTRGPSGGTAARLEFNDHGRQVKMVSTGFDGSEGFVQQTVADDISRNTREITYQDAREQPVRHVEGNLAVTIFKDDWGRTVKQVYSGYLPRYGYESWIGLFDEQGRITHESYRDGQDRPAAVLNGWSDCENHYDADGRRTQTTFTGYPPEVFGASRQITHYDSQGRRVMDVFADENDAPVESCWFGYTRARYTHDAQGRLTGEAYENAQGAPQRNRLGGYVELQSTYDENGRRQDVISGQDGHLGYRAVRLNADEQGRYVKEAFLDEGGQPVACKAGYASTVLTYDGDNALPRVERFDVNGEPTPAAVQVVLVQIVPLGQASRIGLLVGDVIQSYNGVPGNAKLALVNEQQRKAKSYELLPVEVLRGGQPLSFQVHPGVLGLGWEEVSADDAPATPP